ncbi:hypothetical protein EDB84DRAFT_1443793 [Lactarius hengduanensis]|nr:hypothetical protein EDB84DRAFT_1443793 [Lactarius hengduanensis]
MDGVHMVSLFLLLSLSATSLCTGGKNIFPPILGLVPTEDHLSVLADVTDGVQQPFHSFHEKTVALGWNFNDCGFIERDRVVFIDCHFVVVELVPLDHQCVASEIKATSSTEPSLAAAPEAVGNQQPNASSRGSTKRITRSRPAATTQLDPISSGEEFSLQGVEDEDDIPDGPDPSSPSLAPALSPTPPRPAANPTSKALDLAHFFIEIKATKDSEKAQKACKLCVETYGDDRQKVSRSVPNYFYAKNTGNTNLRRHLINHHHEDYDAAVIKYFYDLELGLAPS